jgi:chromosome segregation ATPase
MSVTGILIVISLVLALQLDRMTAPPPRVSSDREADVNADELTALESHVSDLKQELESLYSAGRKTESQAEIEAQMSRMETRVLRLKAALMEKLPSETTATESPEARSRAAEVLRLREEIRSCNEALSKAESSAAESLSKLHGLEEKVREMEQSVIEARAKSQALHLIRERSDTTKEPVIVDVTAAKLKLMRFDTADVIEMESLSAFYKELEKFQKENQYIILYFRPDGAGRFEELRQAVKNCGFEVGYGAIAANTKLSLGKDDAQ